MVLKCFTCKGEHWSMDCPYKKRAAPAERKPSAGAPALLTRPPGTATGIGIMNLSESITEAKLKDLMQQFGPIQSLQLAKDKQFLCFKGMAYIQFKRHDDAAKAIASLNGFVYDGLPLMADWSEPILF